MPKIMFEGEVIEVAHGTNLRRALHDAGQTPHNGQATWFNCKGFGSCGTCAVQVEPAPSAKLTAMERWRLNFPPHTASDGLRLACQLEVVEDVVVTKHGGFWGEHIGEPRASGGEATSEK